MITEIMISNYIDHPPLLLLDRDGVILKHKEPYILTNGDVEFISGSLEALKHLSMLGIPLAVITNQSPVGRGLISSEFVDYTNQWIQNSLSLDSNKIKFYYCPHISEDRCLCRKPGIGMINQACNDFKKRPSQCWIIGDHDTDMQAGLNFSIDRRIFLLSGRQATPSVYATDFVQDLLSFVNKYFGAVNTKS